MAAVFVSSGVSKVRLTGGEPLLRADLPLLIAKLAELEVDLALTTNGSLLEHHAVAMKDAGLARITVSLDSTDDQVFRQMNDVGCPVSTVLKGIDAAAAAGLAVKINCVVKKGVNDHTVAEMAAHFRGSGHILRFIEFMDVGITNGWKLDQVMTGKEIFETIDRDVPLVAKPANYVGEVAQRYSYADGSGEIGIIASVTQPFCSQCTRARLSAEGKLYTCLFATSGIDLRGPLRAGVSDEELRAVISTSWQRRDDRYSELRRSRTRSLPKIEMSYIGG